MDTKTVYYIIALVTLGVVLVFAGREWGRQEQINSDLSAPVRHDTVTVTSSVQLPPETLYVRSKPVIKPPSAQGCDSCCILAQWLAMPYSDTVEDSLGGKHEIHADPDNKTFWESFKPVLPTKTVTVTNTRYIQEQLSWWFELNAGAHGGIPQIGGSIGYDVLGAQVMFGDKPHFGVTLHRQF